MSSFGVSLSCLCFNISSFWKANIYLPAAVPPQKRTKNVWVKRCLPKKLFTERLFELQPPCFVHHQTVHNFLLHFHCLLLSWNLNSQYHFVTFTGENSAWNAGQAHSYDNKGQRIHRFLDGLPWELWVHQPFWTAVRLLWQVKSGAFCCYRLFLGSDHQFPSSCQPHLCYSWSTKE